MLLMIGALYVKNLETWLNSWNMEIVMAREKLVPDAYKDITELSENQIEAETEVLPKWMAGAELENVPKCLASIAEKTWPVVGIVEIWDDITIGTWNE